MVTPVKVYRSTDVNAPQIRGGRGDVKTVIKACCVTGFGDKTSLGWEVVPGTESADGFNAAFRPTDINSAKNIIHVAGNYAESVALTAYFDTDVEGNLVDASAEMLECPTWYGGTHQWILIGHGKSFVFFSRSMSSIGYDIAGAHSRGFFFGEIQNRISNPRGNTMLLRFGGISTWFGVIQHNGSEDNFWNGSWTRISSNVSGSLKWVQAKLGKVIGEMPSPNPLNGEYFFSKVHFFSEEYFRGTLPFGFFLHHRVTGTENFKILQINGVDHILIMTGDGLSNALGHYPMRPFLINMETWEV